MTDSVGKVETITPVFWIGDPSLSRGLRTYSKVDSQSNELTTQAVAV